MGRTSATGLPPNFSLSSAGVLSTSVPITSEKADTYTFDIYITDGIQQDVATFTFIIAASPLPVTLSLFKAVKEEQSASLTWITTSESNSEGFDIERSRNGKEWLKIGYQLAKGESTSSANYYFTDNSPSEGENLYRLKMKDHDGTFAYSRIESLNFGKNETVKIYPNPVLNTEKLEIGVNDWNQIKSVRIVHASGKVVFESDNSQTTGIRTNNLTPGLYIVQILYKNGKKDTSNFIKL